MNRVLKDKSKNKGLTLVEVMVVVVIISVMTSIVTVSYDKVRANNRDKQRVSDINEIYLALTLYLEEHDYKYPKESQIGTDMGFFDGVLGGPFDPDSLIAPYTNKKFKDPKHDGMNYFYYFDTYHQCTKAQHTALGSADPLDIVVYAKGLEGGGGNWSTLCSYSDPEPHAPTYGGGPDAKSYIRLFPGQQDNL